MSSARIMSAEEYNLNTDNPSAQDGIFSVDIKKDLHRFHLCEYHRECVYYIRQSGMLRHSPIESYPLPLKDIFLKALARRQAARNRTAAAIRKDAKNVNPVAADDDEEDIDSDDEALEEMSMGRILTPFKPIDNGIEISPIGQSLIMSHVTESMLLNLKLEAADYDEDEDDKEGGETKLKDNDKHVAADDEGDNDDEERTCKFPAYNEEIARREAFHLACIDAALASPVAGNDNVEDKSDESDESDDEIVEVESDEDESDDEDEDEEGDDDDYVFVENIQAKANGKLRA